MQFVDILPGYALFRKGKRMWGAKVNGQMLCTAWGTLGKLPEHASCKTLPTPHAAEKARLKAIRDHRARGYRTLKLKSAQTAV